MIEKIDKTKISAASGRSTFSGIGYSLFMTVVNKVNEIVDETDELTTKSAIDAQLQSLGEQIAEINNTVLSLKIAPQSAISNVEPSPINVGLNLGFLQEQAGKTNELQNTVNKILAVMRTRKEIET